MKWLRKLANATFRPKVKIVLIAYELTTNFFLSTVIELMESRGINGLSMGKIL